MKKRNLKTFEISNCTICKEKSLIYKLMGGIIDEDEEEDINFEKPKKHGVPANSTSSNDSESSTNSGSSSS